MSRTALKPGIVVPRCLRTLTCAKKSPIAIMNAFRSGSSMPGGAAAHGTFQVYTSLASLTKAKFLQGPALKTPVCVRFSTVAGSRGSSDLARDARGFAVKFSTEEGNYDLAGNNIPVFFIQDAVKFSDLIHAVKPERRHEIPQAASALDTFWDFISLMLESLHMIMWVMSDRAIPRSFRMMEGFGVHTFRFVNEKGVGRFVKFHWKPLLGVHSVLWDEAQKISGLDQISTVATYGKPSRPGAFRNGSWECRSWKRRMNIHLNSICSTRPKSFLKNSCR